MHNAKYGSNYIYEVLEFNMNFREHRCSAFESKYYINWWLNTKCFDGYMLWVACEKSKNVSELISIPQHKTKSLNAVLKNKIQNKIVCHEPHNVWKNYYLVFLSNVYNEMANSD